MYTWPKQKGPTPLYSPFLTAGATPDFSKMCSRHTFNSIGAQESLKYQRPRDHALMPPTLAWGPRKIYFFDFFVFFRMQKNTWILACHFFDFFGDFHEFRPFQRRFSWISGPKTNTRKVVFWGFFRTAVVDCFFVFFPRKNATTRNMKKWLWVYKNHTIVRVAISKKTRAAWGNRVRKNIDFLARNRAEIRWKFEKNGDRGKNRQKSDPRIMFFDKKSIFIRF